jgi:3-oxoacyl-[acyl-carrier protein] reductase
LIEIDLSNRVVIVTGASRGIGRACARLFGRAGATVVVHFREREDAAAAVAREVDSAGGRATLARADLARPDDCRRLVSDALDRFGCLDVLVHNAGIWKRAPILELDARVLDETIDVNLKSAFHLSRWAGESMVRAGRGSLIHVSSTAGQRGEAFYSPYAATKGGLISLVKSLAAELGPRGVRVNAVAPGWVRTDMTEAALAGASGEAIDASIPLGRVATPEEIAHAVVFLASEFSSHVNGEILNVNGGSVLCG